MRFVLLLGVMLVLAACGGTPEVADDQATLGAASAQMGSLLQGTQDGRQAVAYNFVAFGGDGANFNVDSVDVERMGDSVRMLFLNSATTQGATFTFPAQTGALTPGAEGGVSVIALAAAPGTATPDTLFSQAPAGTFTITALDANRISGEFSVTVQNAAGQTLTLNGVFTNLPVEAMAVQDN